MSTINNIPLVPENTTDPAAGLNLALAHIDALLQPMVEAIQNDPPGSPADGDRYVVGTAGTGDWLNQNNKLAVYRLTGDYWDFFDAAFVINKADGKVYYNAGTWQATL